MNRQTQHHHGHPVTGQIVSTELYGCGRGVIFAVHTDPRQTTVDVAFESGSLTYGLPESILRGGQWRLHNEILNAGETAMIVRQAQEAVQKAEEEKAKALAAFNTEKTRLKTAPEYQHLSQIKNGATQVAGNIRSELKKAFPRVKFSVRKRDYNSVNVNWTDGPTEKQVRSITDKYRDSWFDSMQDLSVSCATPFNEIYGGVSHVFTDRDYSDAMKLRAIAALKEKYGNRLGGEEITLERMQRGELWRVGVALFCHSWGVHGEINRILSDMKG